MKWALGILLAVGLALGAGYAARPDGPTAVRIKVSSDNAADAALVESAANELFAACSHLSRYVADFETISGEVWNVPEWDYRAEQYGWTRYVVVTVKISNDPATIPTSSRAWGHTIEYYLGGGHTPGVLTQKLEGQHLCGTMPLRAGGDDSFVAWPAMSLVSRGQDRTADASTQRGHIESETSGLHLDTSKFPQYAEIAADLGLDYYRVYRYREFADATRANDIGTAGNYESLALSTRGSDPWERAPVHWESWYYSNHDVTVIYSIHHVDDRSYVKLRRLARGRMPDLHLN